MNDDAPKPEILVIDDEKQILRLLKLTLEDAGYRVRLAATGAEGLSLAAQRPPGAVILDLGLPDMSGIEVLRQLREWCASPVLILSVLGQEDRKIAALDAGADDYLTKPFGDGELLARLRALLRRAQTPPPESAVVRFGAVEIDLPKRRVCKDGQLVKLTATEYALLALFVANPDRALTHNYLLRELWGPNAEAQTHYLRTYMMRLRRKLEPDPDSPRFLLTESGIGYRFVSEGD